MNTFSICDIIFLQVVVVLTLLTIFTNNILTASDHYEIVFGTNSYQHCIEK